MASFKPHNPVKQNIPKGKNSHIERQVETTIERIDTPIEIIETTTETIESSGSKDSNNSKGSTDSTDIKNSRLRGHCKIISYQCTPDGVHGIFPTGGSTSHERFEDRNEPMDMMKQCFEWHSGKNKWPMTSPWVGKLTAAK